MGFEQRDLETSTGRMGRQEQATDVLSQEKPPGPLLRDYPTSSPVIVEFRHTKQSFLVKIFKHLRRSC